ncbi:MAG: response regulator [Puniceicoccaceae bacterium]
MNEENQQSLPGILYVDDEAKALKYFEKAFGRDYRVWTAESAAAGLEILGREEDNLAIVVSDQRMPGTTGVEFLSEVRALSPDKIRILTTAYSDLDSAIQSVNQGRIYQYVVKPWDLGDLKMVLRRACDFHSILTERNHLMSLKMSTFQRIVLADRTKTLVLLGRTMDPSRGDRLLAAVHTMIRALPSSVEANPARAGGAFVRGGLRDLLRQEREAHQKIIDFWISCGDGFSEVLERVVERFRTGSGGCGPFLCEIETTGAETRIAARTDRESWAAVLQSLFGVLIQPDPSETALDFLWLLARAAEGGGAPVTIAGNDGSGETQIRFSPEAPEAVSGLEEGLALLYDRWDSASLGS